MKQEWRFFRAGGVSQVELESGADLLALDSLDQKLWVALSCPVRGIEFDPKTLELIDSDKDGHVRAPEIIAAAKWAGSMLRDPELLASGKGSLPLSAIDDSTGDGRELAAAARHILDCLGKSAAESISLDDCADNHKILARARFNGDGIVTVDSALPELQQLIREIIETVGAETDRSGDPGVSRDKMERFFSQIGEYSQWLRREPDCGLENRQAALAWLEVKAKVDDYFLRCRLAAYDPRAAGLLARSDDDYKLLAPQVLTESAADLAGFPIARPQAQKPLNLEAEINPAWSEKIASFARLAAAPVLGGKGALSERDWSEICGKFAEFEKWIAAKPNAAVEKLGDSRILELAEGGLRLELEELISADLALEPEMNAVASVERLLRYCRDLLPLANNFVAFRDFYTLKKKATFQSGTLYLDGRSCELCVTVADIARHSPLAALSRVCLAYCDCTRADGEKMTIAAAFTAGDSDQLMVGRNGIFYDRRGRDWDATIVKIIEHPISIRQAFWAPYKRVGKMVGEQLQKLAASKSKAIEEKTVAGMLEPGKAAADKAFDVGKFAGIFAAIGLAVGALGTAVATMLTGLLGLRWWQLPLALAGLVLVVSGPSMLIALFKLRQRNLGPILDANGWAVNSRALINIPFGTSLTGTAKLPEGVARSLVDPFARKSHSGRWVTAGSLLILALVAAWYFGFRK